MAPPQPEAQSTTSDLEDPRPARRIRHASGYVPLGLRHRERRVRHFERDVCDQHRNHPSDYGLTDAELRHHANDLVRSGWRVDEITAVLAVEHR